MGAGATVRAARKKARLTQTALAERSGVSVPTISRIESGTHQPRFDTVERLLRACEMRLELTSIGGRGIDRSTFRLHGSTDRVLTLAEEAGRYGVPGRDAAWDPRAHLDALLRHGVRFVVIGGLGARVWGSPTVTDDTDIAYEHSPENIGNLVAALAELGATLRNLPHGIQAKVDEATFRHSFNLGFDTDSGKLDCLAMPAGIDDFDELEAVAARIELHPGLVVPVASLDDLIRMKRAAGRPKDRIELEVLAALRDERERHA
ncbi:MAG: helix-turn-helix transcriptional regulator [Actinomycetota bacterium]